MPAAVSRTVVRIATAALFLSMAATTLPPLGQLVLHAWQSRSQSIDQKRGAEAAVARRIREQLPPGGGIAAVIVDPRPENITFAMLLNYYLFPLETRAVYGLMGYRVLGDPKPFFVPIDARRPDTIRVTTYPEFRAAMLRRKPRFVDAMESRRSASFIVPLAGSLDGAGDEIFVTEAVMRNPDAVETKVDVEYYPTGRSASVTIPANGAVTDHDLVHQLFGTLDSGWLRLTAQRPVEAAFALVNHGPNLASRIEPVTSIAEIPRRRAISVPSPARLWLVNTAPETTTARIGDDEVSIAGHATAMREISGTVAIDAPPHVIAFASRKDETGFTHFAWARKAE
jgi:hypothetical protein